MGGAVVLLAFNVNEFDVTTSGKLIAKLPLTVMFCANTLPRYVLAMFAVNVVLTFKTGVNMLVFDTIVFAYKLLAFKF